MLRYATAHDRPVILWTGFVALEALSGCLALLLATTPHDATRLSRTVSNQLVLAGTAFLQVGMVLIASRIPIRWSTLVALAVVVATVALLWVLKARNQSAWIAALFAWNPIAVLITLGWWRL